MSTTLNTKLGFLRDDVQLDINHIEKWINCVETQSKQESVKRKERCEICNSKEDYFEGHHIAGRKHDFRQITACKPCHDELSLKQKLRDNRWSEPNQPLSIKEAFFLQGLYDILILKSKKSGNHHYEKYAMLLIEDISKRLKSE